MALLDLKFAWRQLRRSPVFSATAVLTLALGIGVTTAVYSIAREVLLAPLPFPEPQRLVGLDFQFPGETPSTNQVGTAADFLMQYSRSYKSFGVSDGAATGANLAIVNGAGESTTGTHAFPARQLRISQGFLPTLGIQPMLGRNFTAEEDTYNGPSAVILNDRFWKNQFGGDPHVLGRLVRVDGRDLPVVGVLPEGALADLNGGTGEAGPADVWLPRQLSVHDPGYEGNNYQMIARLRDGVSLAQARGELKALLPRFAAQNPWYFRWKTPNGTLNEMRAWPLQAALTGDVRSSLLALIGAVTMVLLVACLNLAGLMASRATSRIRELAVRSALGASRGRLVRLVLAEGLLLAITGALLGMMVAQAAVRAAYAFAPIPLPHFHAEATPLPLAAAAIVLALGSMLGFSLVPMLLVLRRDVNENLRDSGSQGQSRSLQRGSRALIVGQVCIAFVLLCTASLFWSLLLKMRSTALGVDTKRITVAQVTLKGDAYADAQHTTQFVDRVLHDLEHGPGVSGVGAVNGLPLDRGLNISGWPVGRNEQRRTIEARFVSPAYLTTMGITLLQGRTFGAQDVAESPRVAVVSEAAAKRWWQGQSSIGQRINVGNETEYEIVGVVRDTHERSLMDTPGILVYVPLTQVTDRFMKILNGWFPTTFVVRAAAGVDTATALRLAVARADADLPVMKLTTMQSIVDHSTAPLQFFSWLSGAFAGFTVLLATLGLFGLLSYQVVQRTREIGIRMALGATRGGVLRSVLQRGLVLTLFGLALGAIAVTQMPRLLGPFFSQYVFVGAPKVDIGAAQQLGASAAAVLALLVAAALASLLPGKRAASVEPVLALRAE